MIDQRQIAKLFAAVKLSDTEQNVLTYLVNNISTLQDVGVRNIAQACYTSMATVIRLSKKLGYTGFREMLFDLHRLSSTSHELGIDLENHNIHFSCQGDDVNRFLEALDRKHLVGIAGEGYSRLIAEYIEHKLIGSGHQTICQDFLEPDQFVGTYREALDVVVFVSKSGQTSAVVETARDCSLAGIPTVAFTGNGNSDLADICDIVFTIKDNHPFDLKNAEPNCFAGYCLLAFEELLSLSIAQEQEKTD